MGKNALAVVSLLLIFMFFGTSCASTRKSVSKPKYENRSGINKDSKEKVRMKIVKLAKSLIGSQYMYGGKSPNKFDCSGYTSYVMSQNGIHIPPGSYNQANLGRKISHNKAKPGDLIFFGNRGKVNHVALVVDNNSQGLFVVHSTSSKGVIQDNISTSNYWSKRILYGRNIID